MPPPLVLIVDDDMRLTAYLARRLDVPCSTASTLRGGLELARILQPLVIVLDDRLPDGRGLWSLVDFFDVKPDALIIMLSGYMSDHEVQIALDGGVIMVLDKVDIDHLRRWVEILIARGERIHQRRAFH